MLGATKIKLIDVDTHGMPNLALMKLSSHHKKLGDEVGFDGDVEGYMAYLRDNGVPEKHIRW
ncbi:MAG: hypothetical protein KAW47_08945, partial [Thermoplasmatales archaeon]|nr:hypothetical protein [Thermoplasmatales archaeon]